MEPRLGIDFGGVIVPLVRREGRGDTQFAERFLLTDPHPDAFERIQALVNAFEQRVWIVSKAGMQTEDMTVRWMHERGFFSTTGVPVANVRFCRERPEKGPICRELGITHFTDDRHHVMQILYDAVPCLYLFGDKERNLFARRWVTLVANWNEAHDAVMRDLARFGNRDRTG